MFIDELNIKQFLKRFNEELTSNLRTNGCCTKWIFWQYSTQCPIKIEESIIFERQGRCGKLVEGRPSDWYAGICSKNSFIPYYRNSYTLSVIVIDEGDESIGENFDIIEVDMEYQNGFVEWIDTFLLEALWKLMLK